MGFVSFWRGVIHRMLGYTSLKQVLGRDLVLSQEMIDAINAWKNMLSGAADWVDGKNVVSLRIEQGICREFADVAINEMEAVVSNDELDRQFKAAVRDLNENLQDGLGLGSFILKPLGEGKAEFVTADKFVPIRFDDSGRPADVAFLTVKRVGQNDYYTRIERHTLTDAGLQIENRAYHSYTESDIGLACSLGAVDEWSNLEPGPVIYPGMDRMDFGFFRVPLKNRIDGSPCGVSVFAEAADLIQRADVQYGRLDWEYESGERAVHVDERALKTSNGKKYMPAFKNRLYRGLNIDQGDSELFREYSPEMRDEAFIRGLEKAYRRIEFTVGLAYGDLSDAQEVEKTATEIKVAKQRKYNRVTAIQDNLKECLEDFVAGLAFHAGLLMSGWEFSCVFSDSILTDEEGEREQDRKDVAMGAMTLLDYRMKWYQEDEAEAMKHIVVDTVSPDMSEE